MVSISSELHLGCSREMWLRDNGGGVGGGKLLQVMRGQATIREKGITKI